MLASSHWFATGFKLVPTGSGASRPSCVIAASVLDEDLSRGETENQGISMGSLASIKHAQQAVRTTYIHES